MSHSADTPRFSLILASVDRTATLPRLLESLAAQGRSDFELIVVDQNCDNRLLDLLTPYREEFPIGHMFTARGLSHARNVGLAQARGEIVAFPDDDCWYPPGVLEKVDELLSANDWDGLSGTAVDESGQRVVVRWDRSRGFLTPTNVWWRACSVSIFLRANVVRQVGGFDESLGAGAAWGAGEETDYLLRAIAAGARIRYQPELKIGHPKLFPIYDAAALARARSYALGLGKLLTKHRLPLWFKGYTCLRPLGGALGAAVRGRRPEAAFHWTMFRGRISGWLGSTP